jgi:hypothetical protein
MELLPPDRYKPGWPPDLIVLVEKQGWSRILVLECQRMALIQTEHEAMLHVKGNRVHHELSRSYYWPNMTEEIKSVCAAWTTCQKAEVRRQNLVTAFQQAELELTTSHSQGKSMELTSTAMLKEKFRSSSTFAHAKLCYGSCLIGGKKTSLAHSSID